MSLVPKTTEITPKQEPLDHEIQVFVTFYDNGLTPFVSASIVGMYTPYVPDNAFKTERYTFKVRNPKIN